MNSLLSLLQVSSSDIGGGAERTARSLNEAYKKLGHDSWLAVGSKIDNSGAFEIPNNLHKNIWIRAWSAVLARYDSNPLKIKGIGSLIRLLRDCGQPMRKLRWELGLDNFDYPATRLIPNLAPRAPDLIHFHNLHNDFFDLRRLPELSQRVPSVLTLHDAWLLSGHCAFPLDCERWKIGCGDCPDLEIFPSIKRDGTAFNWRQKQNIFKNSKLFVSTPSKWLMDRVETSLIAPAIIDKKVIPNGVDTDIFSPGVREASRSLLNLDQDCFILITAANGIKNNMWKDFKTLRKALEILGQENSPQNILLLAVGDSSPIEKIGNITIQYVPFQKDQAILAEYYRAADVYLHTAKVESFGNVLLEARACGTPVIATAVGGIPEHVDGLAWDNSPSDLRKYDCTRASGILTNPGDSVAFSKAISILQKNKNLRDQMGRNGSLAVATRFSLDIHASEFLNWYIEIISREAHKFSGKLDVSCYE